MRKILLFFLFLIITSCSKPKTVLVCGDHICINKKEAEQYFEENLSLEVKIINKKEKNEVDLVELNLENDNKGNKKVRVVSKKDTNKDIKTLSKNEIIEIKKNLKKKQKIVKKSIQNNNKLDNQMNKNKTDLKDNDFIIKNTNKTNEDALDICTIIKKCNIDEISKYLLKEGMKRDYPDITLRQ